jgi:DNA-binding MarR family transcriptional regulator
LSNEARESLIREVGLAVRMQQNADDLIDEAATEYLQINRTDSRCIDLIDQAGTMTAGELATKSGLSTGAVTAVIDRLEHAGYVRRVSDERDRRKVLVELTDEARRRIGDVYGPIMQWGYAALSAYSDDELVLIRDFLTAGRDFLMGYAEQVRGMAKKASGDMHEA